MPADLRAHIRYPEDYFSTQADMLATYLMTDPVIFYNKQDGSLLGLEGYHIWIEALTSDMSAAKPGETVTVEGATYKIKAPPVHDGDGMSTIELSED